MKELICINCSDMFQFDWCDYGSTDREICRLCHSQLEEIKNPRLQDKELKDNK